ncbi:methyl-accepting chemotaxis protein [Acetobacterium woodii]|uniref:Putative methyl-accepting chemotaxis transducer protein n=1 Tax=Acetobacterium woodii (strain ATCC 29683 / DSM 1030 / JCM 2381 / KCTC 1655 / WB1) TaxID=931626 RepID=H6LJB1_ACEWD|nr:methyl-accepting chemotaxis protein [Acetobacterium woodii]AFA48674.1 putative methyl-accepting chemotaxis transducer protein [Acetobacterium woodii DSM 1030]
MKWFYNLKIGTKLILGFIIVALIAGGIGLIGVINIKTIDSQDNYLYQRMTAPLGELIFIAESFKGTSSDVADLVLSTDNAERKKLEESIQEKNTIFDTNMKSFQTTLISDEGEQLMADIFDQKEKMDRAVTQIITLSNEGKQSEAIALMKSGDYETAREKIETDYQRILEIKLQAAEGTSVANTAIANSSTVMTIILIIIGMIISILLGVFISTTIKNPINKMVTASKRMADGDLDVDIDIHTKDEMGLLADAFNRMATNINEVMVNINEATEQVAAGSRQVSDSSISLSQGATEQASSIEELTASIEEIASQTRLNAEHAEQANQLAANTKENANQGNDRMNQMLGSMEDISESSNNISKIIKVIDEIAFQTNILALNAAVEAAKAGQNGKGFAVVAVEVRNLAARSASAAKETTALIEGSIKKVEGGTKIAKETATALVQIVDSIEKVYTLINNISLASNEQAVGVDQINQGVNQIANVVQSTSATSQETAAASEELASQAEMLKEQVSRFKLKRGGFMGMQGNYENISPEMMRMFENMKEQNLRSLKSRANQETSTPIAKKIMLSDDEFGKY